MCLREQYCLYRVKVGRGHDRNTNALVYVMRLERDRACALGSIWRVVLVALEGHRLRLVSFGRGVPLFPVEEGKSWK